MKKLLIGLMLLSSTTVFAGNSNTSRIDSFVNMKSSLDMSLQRGEITASEYSELIGDILNLVLLQNGEYKVKTRTVVNSAHLNRLQDAFKSMLDSNELTQSEFNELEDDIKDLRSMIN